jgi:hypothetical protein
VDADLAVQYLVEVHDGGLRAHQAVGRGKLLLAVDAEAGQDKGLHSIFDLRGLLFGRFLLALQRLGRFVAGVHALVAR